MSPYHRQRSNELAASVHLDELRKLQGELTNTIPDRASMIDEESVIGGGLGDSIRSTNSSAVDSQPRQGEKHSNHLQMESEIKCNLDAFSKSQVLSDTLPLVHHNEPPKLSPTKSPASPTDKWSRTSPMPMPENTTINTNDSRNREVEINNKDCSSRSLRSSWSRSQSYKNISKSLRHSRSSISKPDLSSMALTKSLRQLPSSIFLQSDEDKGEGNLRPGAKWWHPIFLFSLVGMLACIITLWAPYPIGARMSSEVIATMPWSNGCKGLRSCICPRETICADDLGSMIFLTISRSTAWFNYPLYMLLFMSKAKNLNNFLQKTALRCWINFSDYHHVHSLFGIIVGIESTSHSFFHILRWARRNNDIQLLWTSSTGITGLTAIILCPFIVLPMTVPYLKRRMSFEWRKGLHYFSIVWCAALMCHAPERIFWLIGIPVFIYSADKMVEIFFRTHLVESAHFQRLGDTSCIISFENPPGFGKQNSAYVYLMLPWISKCQFHAFTVFPCTKPNHSSICIHKCGDWTQKLMNAISTPAHKPAFIVGPFLSPFSSPAMDSENLVAVASGIGVTPAISLIKQYSSTSRRLNLLWICRDPGLIEHFLQNVQFGSDGYTLIYYTGKERSLILRDDLPPNIFVFNGRPNLERTIGGIIVSVATGEGLPEQLHKKVLTRTPAEMRAKLLLEKALSIYTVDQLYGYTAKASSYYDGGLQTALALVAAVNYPGILSTMKHLLGDDFELVVDSITKNFEKIDTNGDGRMDRDQFEDFFYLMLVGSNVQEEPSIANVKQWLHVMSSCRDMFESKSDAEQGKDEFGIKKHLQGDGKFSARNWNMLYCGGSQPVLDQLNALERKFGIGLSVEKFDW
eukprot:CAMPEP_0183730492 /NCGR_PEP_ID=MMETSP0737-20130205/32987_1 /TAXON_ID=385413 /ORGANISM="Thalassiosira miniscula, Strain CCMP1093" /LENGTH=858 /DNA_ID=CAMNT_0025963009 /DNA_START=206 /DNA_END=2782 /DNA_ORIENTATION=-